MAHESSSTGIPPIPPRYDGLANAETFGRLISKPDRIDHNAEAFFAAWIAALPAAFEIVSGDDQTGAVNSELSNPLVVKVLDNTGRAVAGVPVIFQVRELDARIDGRFAVTALSGLAGMATAARWRLGSAVGTQHVDVSVEGAKTTFEADASAAVALGSPTRQQLPAKSSGSKTS
jgi:hypothetical protein